MKYVWEDLPKPLNCFTVKNTAMVNLNTGKAVRHYATNTKIVVVQKCVTPDCTYYRTNEAYHHYLNYAFKASDFGLPDEVAPSAPSPKTDSLGPSTNSQKPKKLAPTSVKKQTSSKKAVTPKDGEEKRFWSRVKGIFRRKNG